MQANACIHTYEKNTWCIVKTGKKCKKLRVSDLENHFMKSNLHNKLFQPQSNIKTS